MILTILAWNKLNANPGLSQEVNDLTRIQIQPQMGILVNEFLLVNQYRVMPQLNSILVHKEIIVFVR